MLTLVIETATKACSVALFEGSVALASHHEIIGRGHAERLIPLIASLPGSGKADQIMVDVGPGSFTGIRVGVAAARALGLAWSVPVHGFGCLNLVAAIARDTLKESCAVDVVMTGGHGEYFFEPHDMDGNTLKVAVSLAPQQVIEASCAPFIAGDVDLCIAKKAHVDLLPDARFWHLVSGNEAMPPSPVYGRPPDAKPQKDRAA
ncbi:MAG: tRNA (adenosine(37)-N6)-threonylcarbamoyltransferase complex dimerization subunit type 1 TsaB [Sphingorhabdus sp.]